MQTPFCYGKVFVSFNIFSFFILQKHINEFEVLYIKLLFIFHHLVVMINLVYLLNFLYKNFPKKWSLFFKWIVLLRNPIIYKKWKGSKKMVGVPSLFPRGPQSFFFFSLLCLFYFWLLWVFVAAFFSFFSVSFGYTTKQMGSEFPDHGLNRCHLYWKCGALGKSQEPQPNLRSPKSPWVAFENCTRHCSEIISYMTGLGQGQLCEHGIF